MELIEFKDLPNTDTPINAENLNHNFNELKVESGSNENGSYIKFADGTMICTNEVNNTLTKSSQFGDFLITYAKEFVEVPTITFSNMYSYYRDIIWSAGNIGKAQLRLFWVRVSDIVGENQDVSCNYIAIGRWK